ncbi:EKC/KEOPS complex subunit TP53RK-like [Liolophura sinensis]|uniref:EKC/KEOPS complex subunit TP53RK-like n=1 Tax=Liolophura sinensis TaxID=3198878 RepID=UPI0031585290
MFMKQGAEAKVSVCDFYGKPCIVKERFPKAYRHPSLDKTLTLRRIKAEVRAIMRCRLQGINVPALYFVDLERSCIYMEWVKNSRSVRDYIDKVQGQGDAMDSRLKQLATSIGHVLGRMHTHNIIHGDLTTSNMLLQGSLDEYKLWLIDFGLSDIEAAAEDKGVDLYVLERAILSSHPKTREFFEDILSAYRTANKGGADAVIDKLEEVRLRGRKRTMVG